MGGTREWTAGGDSIARREDGAACRGSGPCRGWKVELALWSSLAVLPGVLGLYGRKKERERERKKKKKKEKDQSAHVSLPKCPCELFEVTWGQIPEGPLVPPTCPAHPPPPKFKLQEGHIT